MKDIELKFTKAEVLADDSLMRLGKIIHAALCATAMNTLENRQRMVIEIIDEHEE
jgi:hypothetical protein